MGGRKWQENLAGEKQRKLAVRKGRERKGGKVWRERNGKKNLAGENSGRERAEKFGGKSGGKKKK
jgi:hypothetical protein